MAGDAPAPRAPASPDTLDAARITTGQRRIDDAIGGGLRPNLGSSLHRDAAAPEGATEATERAAQASDDGDKPLQDDMIEPIGRVAEPQPPPAPAQPRGAATKKDN